ncbi:FemAB family protein [Psychroserpens sp.]|uniref:FemAB family protein n=1 Tax=Psychroserpens sp. TaxID=2020870 RepID=UPI003C755190
MDYHQDRFKDFSLMVYKDKKIIAVLPANIVGTSLFSHQGLTYGGLYYTNDLSLEIKKNVLEHVILFLERNKIDFLVVKEAPTFYGNLNSKSLLPSSGMTKVDVMKEERVLAVDLGNPLKIHKTKLKHFRKNQANGFIIKEEDDFSPFWNKVLCPRLDQKHNTKPVHSLDEIVLLKARFPNLIKQFTIYFENKILAGITIFDKGEIVKSQYGATTEMGEKLRAIEFLFITLIHQYRDEGKTFFSMGTVSEANDLGYNKGLLKQKEELGCSLYFQTVNKFKIL